MNPISGRLNPKRQRINTVILNLHDILVLLVSIVFKKIQKKKKYKYSFTKVNLTSDLLFSSFFDFTIYIPDCSCISAKMPMHFFDMIAILKQKTKL